MIVHITKPTISLCHAFSLWAMFFLQVHALSLSLHRSQLSSMTMMAGPTRCPTALSSTSCWSSVRKSRWWAGGGSSTGIFSQPLARTSSHQGQLFQRWNAESDLSAGLGILEPELAMFSYNGSIITDWENVISHSIISWCKYPQINWLWTWTSQEQLCLQIEYVLMQA